MAVRSLIFAAAAVLALGVTAPAYADTTDATVQPVEPMSPPAYPGWQQYFDVWDVWGHTLEGSFNADPCPWNTTSSGQCVGPRDEVCVNGQPCDNCAAGQCVWTPAPDPGRLT